MSQCSKCGLNHDFLIVTLETISGDFKYCPNCLSIAAQNGFPHVLKGKEICDITGRPDAVKYVSFNETYCLTESVLLRLLNFNLHPDEYRALVSKYSVNNWLLHDDFYDRITGEALQPH